MNTERLLELLDDLLSAEREHSLQRKLQSVQDSLNNLVSQPQSSDYQVVLSTTLGKLRASLGLLEKELTPAKLVRMEEIGAAEFFTTSLATRIVESISENSMTPAVSQQTTSELTSRRKTYLEYLQSTLDGLNILGFADGAMTPGDAEIGFQLPRAMFDNDLDGLIQELRALRRIIRPFSELAVGSAEPIDIRQISTSDPLFFFGLDVRTIVAIGSVITWSLMTWKKVEDIRKVRAETAKLKTTFSDADIKEIFDKRIEETIRKSITAEAERLLPVREGATGRVREQRTDIEWALEALLSRVERGMTVEIRMLPPPATEGEEEADAEAPQAYQDLDAIRRELKFPAVETSPVLALTQVPNGEPNGSKARVRKRVSAPA